MVTQKRNSVVSSKRHFWFGAPFCINNCELTGTWNGHYRCDINFGVNFIICNQKRCGTVYLGIALMFTISSLLVILGFIVRSHNEAIITTSVDYTDIAGCNVTNPANTCIVTMEIPQTMKAPVYMFYKLTNFYQVRKHEFFTSLTLHYLKKSGWKVSHYFVRCQDCTIS